MQYINLIFVIIFNVSPITTLTLLWYTLLTYIVSSGWGNSGCNEDYFYKTSVILIIPIIISVVMI